MTLSPATRVLNLTSMIQVRARLVADRVVPVFGCGGAAQGARVGHRLRLRRDGDEARSHRMRVHIRALTTAMLGAHQ
jgi:hypothetical protein